MAAADEEKAPAAEADAPKKKGGLVKKLLIPVLVLTVAGGAGAWWFLGAKPAEAHEKEVDLETRGLLTFEPFLVNLVDAGGGRFLKISVQLMLETDAEAKHAQESPVVVMQLRSEILEILTQQSAPALVTPEGKLALKKAIRDKVVPHLKHEKVVDVLFSEFVVQF